MDTAGKTFTHMNLEKVASNQWQIKTTGVRSVITKDKMQALEDP